MQKRFKTVSMMLFLMGAISGTAVSAPTLAADDVRIIQQSSTCNGVVKDALGEAIIGASVVVKGTTNGTITDFDGNFSLSDVKKGDVIVISFVGYKTQEATQETRHKSPENCWRMLLQQRRHGTHILPKGIPAHHRMVHIPRTQRNDRLQNRIHMRHHQNQ